MASSETVPTSATIIDAASKQSQTSVEITAIKAAYPNRCRVICDVGQYQSVITLQPENLDVTIKFQLTAAYPSVIPDIKVRSESLYDDNIQQLQDHLKSRAQELLGTEMIQPLMEEAKKMLKVLGMRPGKVKNVNTETFIDEKSKKKKKKQKSKPKPQEEEEVKKLPPMKTAEDVVKRIIWDDNLDTDLFLVGYIDRFRGLMEKYFTAFSWEDIATVDYDVLAIPKHRIQYFKYKDVKVWDKTKRLDNVFGSANGTKTIDVVMKEVEEQELAQKQNNVEDSPVPAPKSSSDDSEDDSDSDDDFITVTIGNSVNIGMSEVKIDNESNDGVSEKDSSNPYWTDKLRPNYFICVRITNPSIIDQIGNIQDTLLQREPILAECCIPGASLHVTICTLGLDTAEQLLQCMEALRKIKSDLEKVLPKSELRLEGVSNFYGRVAYAKVHYEKDFLEFCDFLKLNLQEAGVSIRDGYEFVPHVTIVKITRPIARVRGTKNIDPKYYEQFLETKFGDQSVGSLYLCSMGAERRTDGFYLTPLELHFEK